MAAPAFKDPWELAYPEESTEKMLTIGQRRYTTSKLCDIMAVYELQNRLNDTGIHVNAFDLGFVPGTGLAKNYPPFLRFISNNILPVLRFFVPNVNTQQNSGKRLANLAYADKYKNAKENILKDRKK